MGEYCVFEKRTSGFIPKNPPAILFHQNTDDFAWIVLEPRKQRNLQFHRKAFALLEIVFNAQEKYDTKEQLRMAMTVAAGHFSQIEIGDGKTVLIPQSWAFDNKEMTPERFEDLYSSMIDFGVGLSGIGERELREIVGFA